MRKLYTTTTSIIVLKDAIFGSIKAFVVGAQIHSSLAAKTILQARTLSIKMVAARKMPGTKPLTKYQPNIAIDIFAIIGTNDYTWGTLCLDTEASASLVSKKWC